MIMSRGAAVIGLFCFGLLKGGAAQASHTLTFTSSSDTPVSLAEIKVKDSNGNALSLQASLSDTLTLNGATYPASQCIDNDVNTFCHSATYSGAILTITYSGTAASIEIDNRLDKCCRFYTNNMVVKLDGSIIYVVPATAKLVYTFSAASHTLTFTSSFDTPVSLAEIKVKDSNGNALSLQASLSDTLTLDGATYPASQCIDNDVNTFCHSATYSGATLTITYSGTAASIEIDNRLDMCCKFYTNNMVVKLDGSIIYIVPATANLVYTFSAAGCSACQCSSGYTLDTSTSTCTGTIVKCTTTGAFITQLDFTYYFGDTLWVDGVTSMTCSDGKTVPVNAGGGSHGAPFTSTAGNGYCGSSEVYDSEGAGQLTLTKCGGAGTDGPYGTYTSNLSASKTCDGDQKAVGVQTTGGPGDWLLYFNIVCGPVGPPTPAPTAASTPAPTPKTRKPTTAKPTTVKPTNTQKPTKSARPTTAAPTSTTAAPTRTRKPTTASPTNTPTAA